MKPFDQETVDRVCAGVASKQEGELLWEHVKAMRQLLEDIEIKPGFRKQHYDIGKYVKHLDTCQGGGDQCCPCAAAPTYCNVDQLIDAGEAAHYVLGGYALNHAYRRVGEAHRAPSNGGDRNG